MSLVKDRSATSPAEAIELWRHRRLLGISDHGAECCENAKSWLIALDSSRRGLGPKTNGPNWVAEAFPWGPTAWPIYWCEVVHAKTLDCGALADLTCLIFEARGLECQSVQVIQQYTLEDVRHWTATWRQASCSVDWLAGSFIYHEACMLFTGEYDVRVWDPSAKSWLSPGHSGGYGKTVAIRVPAASYDATAPLNWEGQPIERNVWQELT